MVTVPRKYAQLKDDDLMKVKKLEQELGKIVLAYDPEPVYAELTDEQLRKLQSLEKELGVILLAYKP